MEIEAEAAVTGAALETEAEEDSEEVAAEINVKHIAMIVQIGKDGGLKMWCGVVMCFKRYQELPKQLNFQE